MTITTSHTGRHATTLARVATPRPGTSAAPAVPAEGHPARWRILAVLAAVAFMAQLDLFIVNIAFPAIGRSFGGSSLSSLSWVLNAYAVVFAALLVPAGRLADHFGRRRFLLTGVAIFTVASVACALAPSLGVLVAARAAQAVGAALIVPTSLGLLYPAFPKHQHATVVGIWAGVAAVAASAGPPLGGLLVAADWRWIFLINAPIGVATIVAGSRVLPEVRAERGARLPDGYSVLVVLAGVTLLVLATVQAPVWGWTDGRTLGLFAAAVLATAATVRRTMVHPHALIERSLFVGRQFTTATIALFVFFVGFATMLLISVLFLQGEWHYSPLRAGLAFTPGPAIAAVFALNAGRISQHFGRVVPALAGALLLAASGGYWLVAATASPSYVVGFLPGLVLGGMAAGLVQAPLYAAAGTLPPDRATTGSAVLNMSRQVGSAVGVAVLVALLGTGTHTLGDYQRGWIAEAGAATLTLIAIALSGRQSAPSRLAKNTRR
jgi:EmrB/QacA subfamily drug resistance transporter